MRIVVTGDAPSPPRSRESSFNQRRERTTRFKRAFLVLETGDRVDVVVKNLSDKGARIDFYGAGPSSSGRGLLIEPSLGLQRWARIVWKDRNSAGLSFEAS